LNGRGERGGKGLRKKNGNHKLGRCKEERGEKVDRTLCRSRTDGRGEGRKGRSTYPYPKPISHPFVNQVLKEKKVDRRYPSLRRKREGGCQSRNIRDAGMRKKGSSLYALEEGGGFLASRGKENECFHVRKKKKGNRSSHQRAGGERRKKVFIPKEKKEGRTSRSASPGAGKGRKKDISLPDIGRRKGGGKGGPFAKRRMKKEEGETFSPDYKEREGGRFACQTWKRGKKKAPR